MGGSISVESQVGVGTKFTIKFTILGEETSLEQTDEAESDSLDEGEKQMSFSKEPTPHVTNR